MKRADPIEQDQFKKLFDSGELFRALEIDECGTLASVEIKHSNFGILGGRLVAIDYADLSDWNR